MLIKLEDVKSSTISIPREDFKELECARWIESEWEVWYGSYTVGKNTNNLVDMIKYKTWN